MVKWRGHLAFSFQIRPGEHGAAGAALAAPTVDPKKWPGLVLESRSRSRGGSRNFERGRGGGGGGAPIMKRVRNAGADTGILKGGGPT